MTTVSNFKTLGLANFGHIPATDYDRLYLYLYHDIKENKCKVGERFVSAGKFPLNEVDIRIREGLGTIKSKVYNNEIECHGVWDITEFAKNKRGGLKSNANQVDSDIIKFIGHRVENSAELINLPPDIIINKITDYITMHNGTLPNVSLNVLQADKAEEFLEQIENGVEIFLAQFCARFGKTLWSAVMVKETNVPLTIYTSYVLTAGTSIKNELARYEQFKDIVFVDTSDVDYQKCIDQAMVDGKQVIAFLSLCNGSNRADRVNYLYNLDVKKLTFVDEADFGAHCAGQAELLISEKKPSDVVILMTGTNPDRAASSWNIEYISTVVYTDLLLEKRINRDTYDTTLKHFKVDPSRTNLVVDVEFYYLDMSPLVEMVRKNDPDVFDNGFELPSWSKTTADPFKAKRFLNPLFKNLFYYDEDITEGLDIQTIANIQTPKRHAIMFFSATNVNLDKIHQLVSPLLPNYYVKVISGMDGLSGKEAEKFAIEHIERAELDNKSCLFLASKMAQRSFSVPQISEVYLAYDGGEAGATTQKISRGLTPGKTEKLARVMSLSFDPNRDENIDFSIIQSAINMSNRTGDDIKTSLDVIFSTIDIFRIDSNGVRYKMVTDDYTEQLLSYDRASKVLGKIMDIHLLTDADITTISSYNIDMKKLDTTKTTPKGKTKVPKVSVPRGPNAPKNDIDINLVKSIIVAIAESIDIVVKSSGEDAKTVDDAINNYHSIFNVDPSIEDAFKNHFGFDFEIVEYLIDKGVLNKNLLDLLISKKI